MRFHLAQGSDDHLTHIRIYISERTDERFGRARRTQFPQRESGRRAYIWVCITQERGQWFNCFRAIGSQSSSDLADCPGRISAYAGIRIVQHGDQRRDSGLAEGGQRNGGLLTGRCLLEAIERGAPSAAAATFERTISGV